MDPIQDAARLAMQDLNEGLGRYFEPVEGFRRSVDAEQKPGGADMIRMVELVFGERR